MAITDCRAKPRGRATSFDLSTIGGPALPSEHETFEVISAPASWAHSANHWGLRQGDRILVDWSRRPDKGVIGAIRVHDGVRFILHDGDPTGEVGRLINPANLLHVRQLGAQP